MRIQAEEKKAKKLELEFHEKEQLFVCQRRELTDQSERIKTLELMVKEEDEKQVQQQDEIASHVRHVNDLEVVIREQDAKLARQQILAEEQSRVRQQQESQINVLQDCVATVNETAKQMRLLICRRFGLVRVGKKTLIDNLKEVEEQTNSAIEEIRSYG